MRLTPQASCIGREDGFTPENDIFQYGEFGNRLANLISSVDQPLTFLLDGPWGSGKSTFVRQWAGLLRQRGANVIEFNAFANDHHEDAFVALSAEIIAAAQDEFEGQEPILSSIYESAKKTGIALLPVVGRVALKLFTMGIVNHDDVKEAGEVVTSAIDQTGNEVANLAEDILASRLKSSREEKFILENFRNNLRDLAQSISESAVKNNEYGELSKKYPLVIIIDELDRCRPSFSVNLLERVKHLFSVSGVVFVLVSNINQLKSAVQGAYGESTNGLLYLEKFYDLRLSLPSVPRHQASYCDTYVRYLWDSMGLHGSDGSIDETIKMQIIYLSETYEISLRTIERIATHAALAYAATNGGRLRLAPLIAGLAAIRQIRPDIYQKARNGRMSWRDAKEVFKFSEGDEGSQARLVGWWRYFTDKSMTEDEMGDYHRVFFRYNFSDRFTLVPWGAELIDSLTVSE